MMLDLKKDSIYSRQEIHDSIGGQRQYDISTPRNYNAILLFTGTSGMNHGYHDGWRNDGVFLYSGEGQVGDMAFTHGNTQIRDHQQNGKELHLFRILGEGRVKYVDQMVCIGYNILNEDAKGTNRKIIQFELIPLDSVDTSNKEVKDMLREDLAALKERAMASSSSSPHISERTVTIRERSAAIRAYGLRRARGFCEYCKSKAPFITADGILFLEVHHIKKLADGGPDHPDSIIALCPNCHRRAHYGADSKEVNESMLDLVKLVESRMGQ